jgi:protein-S-isoprenylcysteine O-methyltransferase Ste14
VSIRQFLYRFRTVTPIPGAVILLALADPSPTTLAAGFSLVVLGGALRFWGAAHVGGVVKRIDSVETRKLVTRGPYAWVRNPMYIGNFIETTGILIMAWAWMPWMEIVLWVFFMLQFGLIVDLEEDHLRAAFGEAYLNYETHVNRWLPRLLPWKGGRKSKADWRWAVATDYPTGIILGVLIVSIYLRWKLF